DVSSSDPGATVTKYGLEVRRLADRVKTTPDTTWTEIAGNQTGHFTLTARLAGIYAVRSYIVVAGQKIYSDQEREGKLTIQFPSSERILADAYIRAQMQSAWKEGIG